MDEEWDEEEDDPFCESWIHSQLDWPHHLAALFATSEIDKWGEDDGVVELWDPGHLDFWWCFPEWEA